MSPSGTQSRRGAARCGMVSEHGAVLHIFRMLRSRHGTARWHGTTRQSTRTRRGTARKIFGILERWHGAAWHGARARYAGTVRGHGQALQIFFLMEAGMARHAGTAEHSCTARLFFAPWNAGTARHANGTAHAAQPETQARHAGTARHTLHILERRHGEARLAGTARGDCTGHICRVLDPRQGKPRGRARTRHCTRARHGTADFRILESGHGMAREHCARARHGTAWHASRILGRRRGTRTRQGTFSAS